MWHRVPGLPAIHGASRQSAMLVRAGSEVGQVDDLLEQRLAVQGGVRRGGHVVVDEGQGDVEGSAAQRVGDVDRVELGHHQFQAGVVAAERDEGRRQDDPGRARERADAQRAGQAVAGGGERGGRFFKDREDGLGVPGEDACRPG